MEDNRVVILSNIEDDQMSENRNAENRSLRNAAEHTDDTDSSGSDKSALVTVQAPGELSLVSTQELHRMLVGEEEEPAPAEESDVGFDPYNKT